MQGSGGVVFASGRRHLVCACGRRPDGNVVDVRVSSRNLVAAIAVPMEENELCFYT